MTDTATSSIYISSRLFYKDGSSDKEYHAAVNVVEGGYTVTFAYGRRGSALQAGSKTSSPVVLEKAVQIYDKLIAEKTSKGYTPDGSGAVFAMTENESRVSGLVPQLLNPIDECDAQRHIEDDAWCLQEKFDGKRIMAAVTAGKAEGANRKGLYVSMPQEIADALSALPDCVLDGELIGDAYVVFDLLSVSGEDMRHRPYRERHAALTETAGNVPRIRVAEAAWDTASKAALFRKIADAGGEGVVFKRVDAKSVAGRPAAGGSQVKCKFYATCTCLVAAQNDQRSVKLQLFDVAGKPVNVGNVTIPVNKAIPPAGALVEIRYLYAYRGGSLYQPQYIGERDDLDRDDCRLSQLKYRPDGYAAETEEG